MPSRFKYAVICASNQNRSMEAHHVLCRKGFCVDSFGTNSVIKIPGPSMDKPNSYAFGTTYEEISADLKEKDEEMYTQNGLLMIMERNHRIKPAPQRFQDANLRVSASALASLKADDARVGETTYNVIITCEARCFDLVCEDLMSRGMNANSQLVHVINFDIKDTPEDAVIGARSILHLVQMFEKSFDLDGEIDNLIESFMNSKVCSHPILHAVHFY